MERRTAPRISAEIPIRFRELSKPKKLFAGSLSRNLSLKGIKMDTRTPFTENTRLVLEVTLPSAKTPIRLMGRVAWVRAKSSDQAYECGVHFFGINSEDKHLLREALQALPE